MFRKHIKASLILIVLSLILICTGSSFTQNNDIQKNNWLLGVIFKLERMKDQAVEDIRKYEFEIQKCETTIRTSDNIIKKAQEKGNLQAEKIAREASIKATDAKGKNIELKKSAELKKIKAEFSLSNVKNKLSNPLSQPQKIYSLITNFSGRVSVQKENGEVFDFGKTQSVFLEKGDIIVTHGNSNAELQFLEGRGTLRVGEYSKVKMEEDDTNKQVMNVIQGKVNISVEKLENYRMMIEEKLIEYKKNVSELPEDYEKFVKRLQAKVQKKLHVRTPTVVIAVRGTQFLVYEDDTKGTEVVVLEGEVELTDKNETKTVVVNQGYRAFISKDGKLSEPEVIDISNIERWWEK